MPDDEDPRDWRPRPDPTVLTTEALMREVAHLEKSIDFKIAALTGIMETKFALLERQRVEQKTDSQAALTAALAAAKEAITQQTIAADKAVSKAEAAYAEQFKQINLTFNTAISGPINDLKDRVTTLESIRLGVQQSTSSIYMVVGLMLSLALLAVGALTYFGNLAG